MKHICATLLLLCSSPFSETENAFIQEVKECALQVNADIQPYDRIPINLVIAQAIHESDWGKSRFAVEGNNLTTRILPGRAAAHPDASCTKKESTG